MQDPPAIARRRRHKRYGRNGSLTLRRVLSGPALTGDLFELGAGGCLVWMERAAAFGPFDPSDVIEVRLRADDLTMRVMGFVRHTSEAGRLLGIEFHRLGRKESLDLEAFIAQLEQAADRERALAIH